MDFTANPIWSGEEAKFIIDNFQLRLKAPAAASTAYLSTESAAINNAAWAFTVKLDFNPSGSNYTRTYLVSDQAELSGSLNGYFVMIGDTPDEISLYRQAGTSITKIIDGPDGSVNLSIVNVAIQVTRDDNGNWKLLTDVGLTGTFALVGSSTDNTFDASGYFGVYCNYTSTRSDKFYYDNFLITGDPYLDTNPPVFDQVEVLSSNSLLAQFNEALDPSTANDPNNYTVGNNIGLAALATIQSNGKSVELVFTKDFQNGVSQFIQVGGIKDLFENVITTTSIPFIYFNPIPAKNKDVILTEIFADPSPQVGLPDVEFFEIFNRSVNPFDLAGWTFSDGNSTAIFPSKIILPAEYWIVASNSNVSKFGIIDNIIGLSDFPTLNNSTDTLALKDAKGLLLDSINYDLSWYRSVDKQEGGWSLELIDLNNPCSEEENWTASENEKGGTPGLINSVFANKPDLIGPQLLSVNVLGPDKLLLTFNEKLKNPISLNANFSINSGIEVSEFDFESNSFRSIILELNSTLETKQLYTVIVNNLFDCNGNSIEEDSNRIDFALPEEPEIGDIIINEILFNPRPNGVDFVELYNNSDKYINLKGWGISNFEDEKIENPKIISLSNLIIAPSEYLVLTSSAPLLKNNYPQGKENRFIQISPPSFPDDQGSAAISTEGNIVIDQFAYSKQFHSEFIKDEEGVSLERISFSDNTNDANNWISASANSGFATPGFINSNYRPEPVVANGEIKIDPPIFSPYSGATAFSQINFQFDQAGFIANVKVIDNQGRLIKTLANNKTLGFEGSFRWDGDLEDGSRARAGYYVVWFEVFNTAGLLKTFRERVVIAFR